MGLVLLLITVQVIQHVCNIAVLMFARVDANRRRRLTLAGNSVGVLIPLLR